MRTAGVVAERFHGFGREHPERSVAGRFFDMAKQHAGCVVQWHPRDIAEQHTTDNAKRHPGIAKWHGRPGAERLAGCDAAERTPDASPGRVAG